MTIEHKNEGKRIQAEKNANIKLFHDYRNLVAAYNNAHDCGDPELINMRTHQLQAAIKKYYDHSARCPEKPIRVGQSYKTGEQAMGKQIAITYFLSNINKQAKEVPHHTQFLKSSPKCLLNLK